MCEKSVREKPMGEKSVGEKSPGKNRVDGMLAFVPPSQVVLL